jgi:hypothetical protein
MNQIAGAPKATLAAMLNNLSWITQGLYTGSPARTPLMTSGFPEVSDPLPRPDPPLWKISDPDISALFSADQLRDRFLDLVLFPSRQQPALARARGP